MKVLVLVWNDGGMQCLVCHFIASLTLLTGCHMFSLGGKPILQSQSISHWTHWDFVVPACGERRQFSVNNNCRQKDLFKKRAVLSDMMCTVWLCV